MSFVFISASYHLSTKIWITTIPFLFGIEFWIMRKCQQKMMKEDLQTWITFEIRFGNWIFAILRIKDYPLKVLTLSFHFGNAYFDHGTLEKYWNRIVELKVMKVHLLPWINFENNLGNWIFSTLRIKDYPLKVLTLSFHFGNEHFDRGILDKYWNCIVEPKVMKVHLQPWITFENNLGNWIFATLRIKDHPLKVLTLSFRFGNAYLNRGILGKYWNRIVEPKLKWLYWLFYKFKGFLSYRIC